MEQKIIITIGRQYGSGGRAIGKKLAEDLGIPYYDKELLTVAAKNSGFSPEIFATHDEKSSGSFLYSLVMGVYSGDNLPINHKLFLAQFETIRKLADEGSCVIIGRCADYALESYADCIRVFIHGDLKDRLNRAISEYGIDKAHAQELLVKTDKQRSGYYNFYCGRKWGAVENYDITLNSSMLGIDETAELIKSYIKLRYF